MSNLLTPTSELEAVNAILRTIGEAPLDTINDTFADAAVAKQLLREETIALQNGEWTWNTEVAFPLTPDADGEVILPQNTLRVVYIEAAEAVPAGTTFDPALLVQRGSKLYDRGNHTYTIPVKLSADLVVALNFEELPEAARRFIYVRSGRRFMDDVQASSEGHGFKARDEQASWSALLNYEQQIAQWNVLDRLSLNKRIKRWRPYGVGHYYLREG